MKAPLGFRFAGVACGIKPQRRDVALIASDAPCAAAGVFTVNAAMAAPVADARARLPSGDVRAVIVNSGNANALTGAAGDEAVRAVARTIANALGVEARAVVCASTGVIGVPFPAHKIVDAAPSIVASLTDDPHVAAEAILTTDTRTKTASRALEIDGRAVTIAAIAKGSGMIAPQLATMIAVITTDCAIAPRALDAALRAASKKSFDRLVVDGDMSTNDCAIALANGLAGNAPIEGPSPSFDRFATALGEVCEELAKEVAADGEGATKRVEVAIEGAPSEAIAVDVARAIAGSSLVKAAIFGADPNWGRVLATVGARAGSQGFSVDPRSSCVSIQGLVVFDRAPCAIDKAVLRAKMREPEIAIVVDLRAGDAKAIAWGCDLSYDYVKINADYTSLIVEREGGGVGKDDRLANYTPAFKRALLVEALRYIARFEGEKCVISARGAAMEKESLRRALCDDVLLLRSCGLVPIVVHAANSSDELVATINRTGGRAVGLSAADAALLRDRDASIEVNASFLALLLDQGHVPVIAPVGFDLDRASAAIAASIGAGKLLFLDDAPGLVDGGELVSELSIASMRDRADTRSAVIVDALERGVGAVHLLDGRTPHNVIAELFTDHGVGTKVTKEAP